MVPGGSNPPILGAVAPNFNKIGNMFLIKQNSYYFPLWRGFAAKPNRNFSTSLINTPGCVAPVADGAPRADAPAPILGGMCEKHDRCFKKGVAKTPKNVVTLDDYNR